MSEFGSIELLGAIIAANVTIAVGAFTLIRKVLTAPPNQEHSRRTAPITRECLSRVEAFMSSTEKVLVEASRIQHTQTRYMDDLRQELSHLRTEISELKGMLR